MFAWKDALVNLTMGSLQVRPLIRSAGKHHITVLALKLLDVAGDQFRHKQNQSKGRLLKVVLQETLVGMFSGKQFERCCKELCLS